MARIQVSIDDDILKKVDMFAESVGLSRSAFLSMAALEYISAKEKAPILTGAFSALASAVDGRINGSLSQDDFSRCIAELDVQIQKLSEK